MNGEAVFKLLLKAPARFRRSFRCSWDGLKAIFRKEESFRLESIAFAALLAALLFCPWPAWKRLVLTASFMLIPLAETLNSAIEDVCDLVTGERSVLVKNAKDKGALAVLLAIVLNALALAALLSG